MKINYDQKKFLAYIDYAYELSIGELCNQLAFAEGDRIHPVLYSVLCDRVDLDNSKIKQSGKTLKKMKYIKKYDRDRRI